MSKARIPEQLTVGSLKFRVYQLGDGRLAFSYKKGNQRKVAKCRNIEQLRAEANRIGLGLLNAETAALDMTAEERRIYIAARDTLDPHAVDAVARDVAEARKLVGFGVSMTELARFWIARNIRLTPAPPTAVIVTELIAHRGIKMRSSKYLGGLRTDLERFAAAVPDITTATETQLIDYLVAAKDRHGKPVGPRRRDNLRDAIVTLFRFARSKHYLPQERQTEAEKLERLNPGVEISTYTPAELSHILEHASARWLPMFVLGAFAGLRTSEIFRLEWEHIRPELKTIGIKKRVAKKVRTSRTVPMQANLIAWLSAYQEHSGPLYPNKETHGAAKTWRTLEYELDAEAYRIAKLCGVRWKHNGFRHSYGSHRLAIIKSEDQLAIEMGTSKKMIREHYNDPKPESVAEQYFALKPATLADNILPLNLDFGT